ncbi:MAG: type I-D CRISPR-associated protein Cas5/Csc1 [Chloroflexi bacterium]|nr:MAG: type I-D CRISPR-associated protein Cas5/Csc1 [Chloroflexota bacterium]
MATVPYYSYTPRENKNRVLFGRAKELAPGSTFEFFVFAQEQRQLPQWIRLGKWMSKAEVLCKWYTVGTKEANLVESKEPRLVACPINPLDIASHRLTTFDIIVMPPVSLLTNTRVTGMCCELQAETIFHDKPDTKRYVPIGMSYFTGKAAEQ